MIIDHLVVKSAREVATVQSVDLGARTLDLSVRGSVLPRCRIGPRVRRWSGLTAGDEVRVRLREVLIVYVPPAERGGFAMGLNSRSADAHVLAVDPSYRLLELRYPDGTEETLKMRLHIPMQAIQAGDAVAVRRVTIIGLRVPPRPERPGSRPRDP
jgi:hypothetical protein